MKIRVGHLKRVISEACLPGELLNRLRAAEYALGAAEIVFNWMERLGTSPTPPGYSNALEAIATWRHIKKQVPVPVVREGVGDEPWMQRSGGSTTKLAGELGGLMGDLEAAKKKLYGIHNRTSTVALGNIDQHLKRAGINVRQAIDNVQVAHQEVGGEQLQGEAREFPSWDAGGPEDLGDWVKEYPGDESGFVPEREPVELTDDMRSDLEEWDHPVEEWDIELESFPSDEHNEAWEQVTATHRGTGKWLFWDDYIGSWVSG